MTTMLLIISILSNITKTNSTYLFADTINSKEKSALVIEVVIRGEYIFYYQHDTKK